MTTTDPFIDELTADLRARRDAASVAARMPDLDAVLTRAPVVARTSRRGAATTALAAAAVVLLVIAAVVFVRQPPKRVTVSASQARQLIGPSTPFLLPPGEHVKAEIAPSPQNLPRGWVGPSLVNGTIATLVAGDVGDRLRFLVLASAGPADDSLFDPFSSLRRSDMFDPTVWFRDPNAVRTTEGQSVVDVTTRLPGAEAAVLATQPNLPSIVAIRRGTTRIALVGGGLSDDDLIAVAHNLRAPDGSDVMSFGAMPDGFRLLVPAATSPAMSGRGYGAWSSSGGIGVSGEADAAWQAAVMITNTGAFRPDWIVLRSAPNWVLQLDGFPRNLVGLRHGGWVEFDRANGAPTDRRRSLASFDGIRKVDLDTFAAALGLGSIDTARRDQRARDEVVARVKKWGGWVPRLPSDYLLADVTSVGNMPPTGGGLPGLTPLWNPTSGAVLGIADVPTESSGSVDDVLLGTEEIAGRTTELRSWPTIPGEVHAVFDDGAGHRVQTVGAGATIDEVRAYVAGIRDVGDDRWTASPPPGYEPLPLARPVNATESRNDRRRSNGITGVEMSFTVPNSKETVSVLIDRPGARTASDTIAQFFFGAAPIERMTTGSVTWFRTKDARGGQHRVAIAGSDTRPTVIVASSVLTDDQLFDIANSVDAATPNEVDALFAPWSGR